ncbi:MAG: crossover junction endodeoxyribonuclease RuvC [Verrucomicrobia bacterium]|nr:crossover junction endodeoxyribonuclease RuvC [Verrucomicrobiota bacterium]
MEKKTPDDLIILGIDPGTCLTGYGIIKYAPHRQQVIDFGCIRPPPKKLLSHRYLIIFNGLSDLMDKYKPQAVSIETQFVSKNPQGAIKLGMARGMAVLAATQRNIPIYEYAPKRAKQAAVGNGSASKEQVQKMMQILFNLPHPPEPEDAADALALALCHGHTLSITKTLEGLQSL